MGTRSVCHGTRHIRRLYPFRPFTFRTSGSLMSVTFLLSSIEKTLGGYTIFKNYFRVVRIILYRIYLQR